MSLFFMWNEANPYSPAIQLFSIIGTVLAIVICWSRTENVWVSALAGYFGWFYIAYYLVLKQWQKLDARLSHKADVRKSTIRE
jgi:tryptophan-rich sensory protein